MWKCNNLPSTDPFIVLMTYRTTPLLWCKLSLAELLMVHKVCTNVPKVKKLLIVDWPPYALRSDNCGYYSCLSVLASLF